MRKFESSFQKLVKSHYRKNIRAKISFEELVDNYIQELRQNPSSNTFSEEESVPKGCYDSAFELRKIRFKMPELQGASRYGRLMYVVHEVQCTVYLLWIYTHEEFPKRPGDDDLRVEIRSLEEQSDSGTP